MIKFSFRWKLLIHLFIIFSAIIMLFVANAIGNKINDLSDIAKWQTILISIACSMIASAIISILINYFMEHNETKNNVIVEWGINKIAIRADMNRVINNKLDDSRKTMDVIALGMRNFISVKGDLLLRKVSEGFTIRILTLDPVSQTVKLREETENVQIGSIKKSIEDLVTWSESINTFQSVKGTIEIRKYDSQLLDTYQNIDGDVFIGPHLHNKPSQQSITYYFKKNTRGAIYYSDNFNKLWNDTSFCK